MPAQVYSNQAMLFQFQSGTIKGVRGEGGNVSLQTFQFQSGAIKGGGMVTVSTR